MRRRVLEWLVLLFLVEGIAVLTLLLASAFYRYVISR